MSFEGLSNSVNQNTVNWEFEFSSLYENPQDFISLATKIKEFYLTQKWDQTLIHSCDKLIEVANQISLTQNTSFDLSAIKTREFIANLEMENCTVLNTLGPALTAICAQGAYFIRNKLCKDPLKVKQDFIKRLIEIKKEKEVLNFKLFISSAFSRNLVARGDVQIQRQGLIETISGSELHLLLYLRAFKTENNLKKDLAKIEKQANEIIEGLRTLHPYVDIAKLCARLRHLNIK